VAKPPEAVPELSKHLVIMADCQWPSSEVQTQVLKAVCQAMVQERLHTPFWFNKYYIKLLSFAIKDGVIQYKVHISEDHMHLDLPKTPLSMTGPGQTAPGQTGPGQPALDQTAPTGIGGTERAVDKWQKVVGSREAVEDWQKKVEAGEAVEDWQKQVEDWQKQVEAEEAVEDWQKKVEAGEAVEDWQKQVEAGEVVEDWQKEVEEDDLVEDNQDLGKEREKETKMGLPFLSGLSHTGFLSAHRKQSAGSNLLVQVGLP